MPNRTAMKKIIIVLIVAGLQCDMKAMWREYTDEGKKLVEEIQNGTNRYFQRKGCEHGEVLGDEDYTLYRKPNFTLPQAHHHR